MLLFFVFFKKLVCGVVCEIHFVGNFTQWDNGVVLFFTCDVVHLLSTVVLPGDVPSRAQGVFKPKLQRELVHRVFYEVLEEVVVMALYCGEYIVSHTFIFHMATFKMVKREV